MDTSDAFQRSVRQVDYAMDRAPELFRWDTNAMVKQFKPRARADGRASLLPSAADEAVNMALRSMHSAIAQEPLPADLQAILDQIDAGLPSGTKDQ